MVRPAQSYGKREEVEAKPVQGSPTMQSAGDGAVLEIDLTGRAAL